MCRSRRNSISLSLSPACARAAFSQALIRARRTCCPLPIEAHTEHARVHSPSKSSPLALCPRVRMQYRYTNENVEVYVYIGARVGREARAVCARASKAITSLPPLQPLISCSLKAHLLSLSPSRMPSRSPHIHIHLYIYTHAHRARDLSKAGPEKFSRQIRAPRMQLSRLLIINSHFYFFFSSISARAYYT